jgi:transcriptional regulator with XRE-family HTH domain
MVRLRAGLSQTELAARMGVSHSNDIAQNRRLARHGR